MGKISLLFVFVCGLNACATRGVRMGTDPGFYSVIEFSVDGSETQKKVVESFASIQERMVRSHPGYRSARFLASVDGKRVFSVVHWSTEADFQRFEKTVDPQALSSAIDGALASMEGKVQVRIARYTLMREVFPGL